MAQYEAARSAWKALARKACGASPYKELRITESAGDAEGMVPPGGVVPYVVTRKMGYVLCLDGRTSEADAAAYIEKNTAR